MRKLLVCRRDWRGARNFPKSFGTSSRNDWRKGFLVVTRHGPVDDEPNMQSESRIAASIKRRHLACLSWFERTLRCSFNNADVSICWHSPTISLRSPHHIDVDTESINYFRASAQQQIQIIEDRKKKKYRKQRRREKAKRRLMWT